MPIAVGGMMRGLPCRRTTRQVSLLTGGISRWAAARGKLQTMDEMIQPSGASHPRRQQTVLKLKSGCRRKTAFGKYEFRRECLGWAL